MGISDLFVLVVILIAVLVGWKKGLMLSLFSLLSIVLAVIVGIILTAPVAAVINTTSLPGKIEKGIYSVAESAISEELLDSVSVSAEEILEAVELPDFVNDYVQKELLTELKEGTFDSVAGEISKKATDIIVSVMAFTIVSIITFIALLIIKIFLKILKTLPVIKEIDTVGGILFGIASGLLIVCIAALLLVSLSTVEGLKPVVDDVNGSLIASFFYENNFLGQILAKFF